MASTRQIALVETSEALPGLLPFQAWDVLGVADQVWARDPAGHPSASHLRVAGLELMRLDPAGLERSDLDLAKPGSPSDRRLAKALAGHAATSSPAVYLLGPDDAGLAAALAGMAQGLDLEIELVFFTPQPPGTELLEVVKIMARLRDPAGGCPWDLEQSHRSLLRYLIEEAYELVAAIEEGSDDDIREELGDVLLQVMFHAQVAAERGAFAIDDVARNLVDKLVRRHPHVFADADAATASDVQTRWDELKAVEKGRTSTFDGVPRAMPGLQLLDKILVKAQAIDPTLGVADPEDEIRRVLGSDIDPEEQVRRLLAAVVALARRHDIDAESAARAQATQLREQAEQQAELDGL